MDFYTNGHTNMRVNIDLPDDIVKELSKMAIDSNTDRKNYIQSILVLHARGGFKDKKPSTKRKLKHWMLKPKTEINPLL